ncbi:FtsX-like permease family protein [Actinomadura xylanilytica]|uniref:FtsX-like permease family protein n=1 Tax=Actinomadura xylanilytica TaxID=887459 RepID=UPI00255B0D95|nr:FtsX-like permease family protein [Actinomadura xylanilytica]MDL4774971.1 ABC transporter permease [Actinomadura xylanilytica]
MLRLSLSSLRRRRGAFAASFLAMFLGATILMAFASLLDTAEGTSGTAKSTLTTMALVVGGWGLVLVVFAVTSTLTLSVRQRGAELALLKSVGATPAQLGRMIVGETGGLAVVAALLAVPAALLAGRGLLGMLHASGQVPDEIGYAFGPVALTMGLGITFASATGAALITARRATRVRVTESLMAAAVEPGGLSRKRIVGAVLFLALALNLGVVTATMMRGAGTDAMATSGQADIFAAIGLALLAPLIIRLATGVLAGPLRRLGGVAGELAVTNLRRRTGQMASVLTPIILFTGTGVGTLYLQDIENASMSAAGLAKTAEQKDIETLNFVVIGMIVVFTAIMLVNTLVTATTHRRREFGQQRLAGATPGQVLGTVALESAVLAATGVVCGAVAALFTVLPFSIARSGTAVPDGGPGIFVAVAALAVVLTGVTALGTARRTVRTPAVAAVGV